MLRLVSLEESVDLDLYTEGISCIYAKMLKRYGLTFYSHIHVIHAGKDGGELIIFEPGSKKDVNVKVKYDIGVDFLQQDDYSKQLIFTNIIHTALLRLAAQDKHLDIAILETIKAEIIAARFDFRLVYKQFVNSKNKNLVAKVIVHPFLTHFNIYLEFEESGVLLKSFLIYKGAATTFYLPYFFSKGKWLRHEFVLDGKDTDMEIHVLLADWTLKFVTVSAFPDKAPRFELNKADADKETALRDYLNSLNPAIVAVITGNPN